MPVFNYKLDENGVMSMEMILKINGVERSRSNYDTIYHTHPTTGKKQAWRLPRIMSWLGQNNIALYPGYILGSGTVGNGCIAEFSAKLDPQTGEVIAPAVYPWLKNGDVVTMEAEGIGVFWKIKSKLHLTSWRKLNNISVLSAVSLPVIIVTAAGQR